MPMTDSGMSAAIKAAIIAKKGAPPAAGAQDLQDFCDSVGKAVVEYIQANAVVTGEVTSGSGAGGTVTGSVS